MDNSQLLTFEVKGKKMIGESEIDGCQKDSYIS